VNRPGRTPFRRARFAERGATEYIPAGRLLRISPTPRDGQPRSPRNGEQLAGLPCWRRWRTLSGGWIYCGLAWAPPRNLLARRDNSEPYRHRQTLKLGLVMAARTGAWCNRASCESERQTVQSASGKLIAWNGHGMERRGRAGLRPTRGSLARRGPFIMKRKAVSRVLRARAIGRRAPSPSIRGPSRHQSPQTR